MAKHICITIGHLRITAQLNDSRTAQKVWDSLPLSANVTRWGKEIYFPIPIQHDLEKQCVQDTVEKGDLAFWPEGNSFCIFFGPT
ncbi:MAG TPA: cyclophilin-like fold protein, partial [Candidatus Omnitrophota bacterium]|nr:cyclophilin-like fold protein [Candidatus Omnitrophota bacterium]